MALRYLGLVLLTAAVLVTGCKSKKGSEVRECSPCCASSPMIIDGGCCGIPVSSGGHHGGGGGGGCGCGGY